MSEDSQRRVETAAASANTRLGGSAEAANEPSDGFKLVTKTLARNLERVRNVCHDDESPEGRPQRMSQIDFCKSVGIGRATLTDLLAALNDNFEKANVTLESLCKIADYLGIPLFFLFMGRDDWTRIREALRWYDGVGANEEYVGQSKHGEPTTSQSENRKRDELLDLVCKMQGVSVEERARWASTAIQLIEGSFLTKEQTNVEGAEVRAAPRWRTHTDEPVVPKEERRRQKALMALAPLDSAAGEAKKEAPEILRLMTIAVIAGKREQMLQSRFTNGSKE